MVYAPILVSDIAAMAAVKIGDILNDQWTDDQVDLSFKTGFSKLVFFTSSFLIFSNSVKKLNNLLSLDFQLFHQTQAIHASLRQVSCFLLILKKLIELHNSN